MKQVYALCSISALKLMGSHGPSCVCSFCVTAGRVRFFCTQPERAPRFVEWATIKVRLLYTQLVDVAEGFCPAFELPGQPFLGDPGLPPRPLVAQGKGGADTGPPERSPSEEVLRTAAAKFKAAPAGEVKDEQADSEARGAASTLPRTGEAKEEQIEKETRKSAPIGHREKKSRTRSEQEGGQRESPVEEIDKRRRSAPTSRQERKRSKKSRSRRRRRSRSRDRSRPRRRSRTPEYRGEKKSPSREEERGREKKKTPERRAGTERGPVPEPAFPPSRASGRGIPRPPSVPPPTRGHWSGPIRAHRREEVAPDTWEQRYWPKSKGVKRRENNRAFRESNYGRGWGEPESRRR